jgi:hypothetical protein
MHRDFGSIASGNPLIIEINSGEDERGTVWYFLIVKLIVQEAVEVFRSAKQKLHSKQRREEESDTEAAPSRGADPELLATMRALATSIQTMQVGQRCTDHFLQAVAEQQQRIQQELRERVTWGTTLRAAQASAAEADALLRP